MANQDRHSALISEGQPLVHSLATMVLRRLPMRVDLEDLIAYGQLGLAEAAKHFDATRGNRFTTFAYYRIKGAIYDGVSKMSWTSRGRLNRLRFQRPADCAAGEAPREPDRASASGVVSVSDESNRLARVILTNRYDPSEGGQSDAWVEDPAGSPATLLANREIFQRLDELVKGLPRLQQILIQTVYYNGATLQEAAIQLGISKSWASRVHAQTLQQLAMSLRKLGADG